MYNHIVHLLTSYFYNNYIIGLAILCLTVFIIVCLDKGFKSVGKSHLQGRNLHVQPRPPPRRIAERLSVGLHEIGINFNKWRKPICEFGEDQTYVEKQIEANLGNFHISTEKWKKATQFVDTILGCVFSEMKNEARKYDGLNIEQHIRQGSSREGLKIEAPDEFDVLLQFSIRGLNFEVQEIEPEKDQRLPELCYLLIQNHNSTNLAAKYPQLYRKGVFEIREDRMVLNPRKLQEHVFTSIVDRARHEIEEKVRTEAKPDMEIVINRQQNPPSINITIQIYGNYDDIQPFFKRFAINHSYTRLESRQSRHRSVNIDIDIVPALLIREDKVPNPLSFGATMNCPVHAVFKWKTDNHPFSTSHANLSCDLLWRLCSSGYEKHLIDIANGDTEQRYIVTALRIIKASFSKFKTPTYGYETPQIFTVLRSYHLKHVAFFCILYLRILNKAPIKGVGTALEYFLQFLEVCLKEKCLPHFLHGNPWVCYMFPEYKVENCLRYNLFVGKSDDALRQALHSFRQTLRPFVLSLFRSSDEMYKDYVETFEEFVQSGEYYE